jgi:hypothetical protein
MAINFFSIFPRTGYTLDDYASQQVVVDIFKRVIFSKEYQENSSYYEKYEVLYGETPEEISYRFYGTTSYHWLVLMVNDITDPRFDWPLSEQVLTDLVESKYGSKQNIFATNRAKNAKGYQVETFFVLTEESSHKEPQRLLYESNDPESINTAIAYDASEDISYFESNFEVETEKNEINRTVKILKPEIVQEIISNYQGLINP